MGPCPFPGQGLAHSQREAAFYSGVWGCGREQRVVGVPRFVAMNRGVEGLPWLRWLRGLKLLFSLESVAKTELWGPQGELSPLTQPVNKGWALGIC